MKIYYFPKPIIRKSNYHKGINLSCGTGRMKEYTSKEELIADFEEMLDCNDSLTAEEIESIVCEDVPDYDYYTIQYIEDDFNGYITTAVTFKTYEECVAWLADYTHEYEHKLTIVGQRWGTDYREVE
jgi:serine protease inhibitor ecotin